METPTLPESAGVCGQSSDSADSLRTGKPALVRHCNKCLSVTAFDLDVTCANAKALKRKGQTVRIVSADEFEKVQLQQCQCGEQPAPDEGEPWSFSSIRNCIYTRDGKQKDICDSLRNRSLQCVNACAGMADPAKEIAEIKAYASKCRDGCIALSHSIDRIDYLCGEPNEMGVSDYCVHQNDEAVVERVKAKLAELKAMREALQSIESDARDLRKFKKFPESVDSLACSILLKLKFITP